VSDAIHSSLADVQSSLTATHSAESPDGTVRAEATAKRQVALHLSPAAMRLRPDTLAALVLATQQEAQAKAEAALAEALDTFRADPRVTAALDVLRDTQASPRPLRAKARAKDDDEEEYVDSVYNSDRDW
jgi:acyl-coenzyme A thioesterase PaaI-like protein